MLAEIEDLAKCYYSQDMIDYNLYGVLLAAIKCNPKYLMCVLFMPKNLYDRYYSYIRNFCKCKVPDCFVSWDTATVQIRNYNYLSISELYTH